MYYKVRKHMFNWLRTTTLLSYLLIFYHWLLAVWFYRHSLKRLLLKSPLFKSQLIRKSQKSAPPFLPYRQHKKPPWVLNEILYLKAVNPSLGCRHIAHLFNRRFAAKKHMTVSKSYVYEKLIRHQYEVLVLRRKIKHKRPKPVSNNHCWGMDLTTVTDQSGAQNTVFAIVDYGSRRCLLLQHLANKSSLTLLHYACKTIRQYGLPKAIKTDNEACFTSFLFRTGLFVLGIQHQRSDVACPWQNGRVERFIGTFKNKIRQVVIHNAQ